MRLAVAVFTVGLIFGGYGGVSGQQSFNPNPLDQPDPRPGPELLTGGGAGDFLIYPFYTVVGEVTFITVANTSNTWYQVRVIVHRGFDVPTTATNENDSFEVIDFPVILSPNDVFTFRLEEDPGAANEVRVRVTGNELRTLFNHELYFQARDGLVNGVTFDDPRNPQEVRIVRPNPGLIGSRDGYVTITGEAVYGTGTATGVPPPPPPPPPFRRFAKDQPLPEGGLFPGPRGTSTLTWAAVRGGLDGNPATQDLGDGPNALIGTAYPVLIPDGRWDSYNALAIRDFRVTAGNHVTENYTPDDAVILVDENCIPGTTGGFNGAAFCAFEGAVQRKGAEINNGDGGVAEMNNLFYRSNAARFFNGEATNATQVIVLFPTRRYVTPFDNSPSVEVFDTDENRVSFISPLPVNVLPGELNVVPINTLAQLQPVIQGGWLRMTFGLAGTTTVALTRNTHTVGAGATATTNRFIGYFPCQKASEEAPGACGSR